MRILRPAAGLLLCAIMLSGCVPTEPADEPSPEPTSASVFASEEEALTAAEEAYAEYLAVSDAISQDGGANPERIEPLVTEDRFPIELELFSQFEDQALRTEGATAFDSLELQQYDGTPIHAYVCLDVTDVRVFDAGGQDVTPTNRPGRLPLQIQLVVFDRSTLLAESDVWDGDNFCEP